MRYVLKLLTWACIRYVLKLLTWICRVSDLSRECRESDLWKHCWPVGNQTCENTAGLNRWKVRPVQILLIPICIVPDLCRYCWPESVEYQTCAKNNNKQTDCWSESVSDWCRLQKLLTWISAWPVQKLLTWISITLAQITETADLNQ